MATAQNSPIGQQHSNEAGFEYMQAGDKVSVRLRRSVAFSDPVGISFHRSDAGKVTSIERIDLSPTLRGMNRAAVQKMLIEAFQMLTHEAERELALTRLEKLVQEGLCARCILAPVAGS